MSYQIYLCGNCWGPIWFPFGEKMHLGTGWYCWQDEQSRNGPFSDIIDLWFDFNPSLLEGPLSRAVEHYTAWNPRDTKAPKSPLIPYLRKQLAKGRGDVIYRFLQHLAREPREKVGPVIRELTQTPEWRRFVKHAAKHAGRRASRSG